MRAVWSMDTLTRHDPPMPQLRSTTGPMCPPRACCARQGPCSAPQAWLNDSPKGSRCLGMARLACRASACRGGVACVCWWTDTGAAAACSDQGALAGVQCLLGASEIRTPSCTKPMSTQRAGHCLPTFCAFSGLPARAGKRSAQLASQLGGKLHLSAARGAGLQ